MSDTPIIKRHRYAPHLDYSVVLTKDLDKLEREVAALREALESAKAAIWDAYYGKGISIEYARSVTGLIDAALKKGSP